MITSRKSECILSSFYFPSLQLQKQKADALGGTQAGTPSSGITMPANLQISSGSRRRKRNVNSNSNVNLQVSRLILVYVGLLMGILLLVAGSIIQIPSVAKDT